jgi:hypothetical protein
MGPKDSKTLTGTRFGNTTVRVPAPYRSQVRAGIHNLEVGKVESQELGIYAEQLLGRLLYINQVCPQDARPLRIKLSKALPLIPPAYREGFQAFIQS